MSDRAKKVVDLLFYAVAVAVVAALAIALASLVLMLGRLVYFGFVESEREFLIGDAGVMNTFANWIMVIVTGLGAYLIRQQIGSAERQHAENRRRQIEQEEILQNNIAFERFRAATREIWAVGDDARVSLAIGELVELAETKTKLFEERVLNHLVALARSDLITTTSHTLSDSIKFELITAIGQIRFEQNYTPGHRPLRWLPTIEIQGDFSRRHFGKLDLTSFRFMPGTVLDNSEFWKCNLTRCEIFGASANALIFFECYAPGFQLHVSDTTLVTTRMCYFDGAYLNIDKGQNRIVSCYVEGTMINVVNCRMQNCFYEETQPDMLLAPMEDTTFKLTGDELGTETDLGFHIYARRS